MQLRQQQRCVSGRSSQPRCLVAIPAGPVHRRCRLMPQAVLTNPTQTITAGTTYTNANFPVDAEGRTYHLGTKAGEVAPRVLSVGSTARAQLLSTLLDAPGPGKQLFSHLSSRGFLTITGTFQGLPVSIISTHMGTPNMDFVVRESRAVVEGPMAIVRLGTCGAVQPPARLGDLLVASAGSIAIRRNPDAWAPGYEHLPRYTTTLPVAPDHHLAALLVEEAGHAVGRDKVVQGLNATADSFYSSQGRLGGDFDDHNEELLGHICGQYPNLVSLEMETFHLLDLARCAAGGSIRAVGMCIALAERYSNRMMDHAALEAAEIAGGRAALTALARVTLTPVTNSSSSSSSSAAASNGHSNGHNNGRYGHSHASGGNGPRNPQNEHSNGAHANGHMAGPTWSS